MRFGRSALVFVSFSALNLLGCIASTDSESSEGGSDGDEVLPDSQRLFGSATLPLVEGPTAAAPTGDYCSDVTSWKSTWVSFENAVLSEVNARRAAGATCGGVAMPPAPPLSLDTSLRCAGRKHSKDMATNNFASHTGSDGSSPWDRMAAAGYTSFSTAGENVAGGYSTPAAVVNGWMASSGHCSNIMNAAFVDTGIGYYSDRKSTYTHYWTQDFATPP